MGSIGLPDKNSPDVHLVIATREELMEQQHVNSEEWRGALPLEAYIRREVHLYSQDLTKDGGLTPWMLVYQPDRNGPRQVLCGCESIKKKALVAKEGKVEDVTCHGVCSVFCPPQNRGHGYAGRMMKEVAQKLKDWQADNGKSTLFSALWSDIGKDFYAAKGWHPFPSAHVSLAASRMSPPENVRLLRREDLAELCSVDEKLIRQQMTKLKSTDKSAIAIVPDYRTVSWQQAREDFVSKELYGKSPSVKGAMVGDKPGSRVWAYFARVWANPQEQDSDNTLYILRLVVEDEAFSDFAAASPEAAEKLNGTDVVRAIAACLQVAQSEAAQWDMKKVSIWNPTSATLAAAQPLDRSVTVVHREEESISSLLWYGEGSFKDVDWVCNEKYEWC